MKKPTELDEHGQPLVRSFNAGRLSNRTVDELIGICKGVLADGRVEKGEAEFLMAWMERNRDAANMWPGSVLYPRIARMLEDDVLDEDEQGQLLDLLMDSTGERSVLALKAQHENLSATLPLTKPAPKIEHDYRSFCFTGKLLSCSRRECEKTVESLGGVFKNTVSFDLDYLVIGRIGSSDWLHTTHGTKIQKAVKLRDEGSSVAIVSEEHWQSFL